MQPKSTPQGPSPPHDTSRRDVSLSATREAEQLRETYFLNRVIVNENKIIRSRSGSGEEMTYILTGNKGDELFCSADSSNKQCWDTIRKFGGLGPERIETLTKAMGRLYPGLCQGAKRRNPAEKQEADANA